MKMKLYLICLSLLIGFVGAAREKGEFFLLRTYYFETADQETRLDNYLKDALLPALHRMKLQKIGVFKPLANDTARSKRLVVFIPFANLEQWTGMESKLLKDTGYQKTGADYINAAAASPVYTRIESVLLDAFPEMRTSVKPDLSAPAEQRVYELRSYEGATEKLYQNKVKMFNEGGEVSIFRRLGFNAVFYGKVLAGSHMPNLMYMTSFDSMDERQAHWKAFSADPEWKKLLAMLEYQKNVSRIEIILMRGVPYSDL